MTAILRSDYQWLIDQTPLCQWSQTLAVLINYLLLSDAAASAGPVQPNEEPPLLRFRRAASTLGRRLFTLSKQYLQYSTSSVDAQAAVQPATAAQKWKNYFHAAIVCFLCARDVTALVCPAPISSILACG